MIVPPDFSSLRYDEFVTFTFDHPAFEGEEYEADENGRILRQLEQRPKVWYWDLELSSATYDPVRQLAHLEQLFLNAADLLPRFTVRQIVQGFSFLLGVATEDVYAAQLWNAGASFDRRAAVLAAVPHLYADLFDRYPAINYVPFMFWDLILEYRFRPDKSRSLTADEERLRRKVLSAIRALFDLDGCWSVPSALHGCHHVNHPVALAMVREFLQEHHGHEDEWTRYGQQVLLGEAL